MEYKKEELIEFLRQSNAIESEYSEEALEDSLKAWEYVEEMVYPSVYHVLQVHGRVLDRLRPDIAGRLRDTDVFIGGSRRRFINENLLSWELENSLQAMRMSLMNSAKASVTEKEEMAKRCHILFETVHPFEDGNGRTGRILYNWHRLKMGLPLHIIHAGVEQMEYYKWFKE